MEADEGQLGAVVGQGQPPVEHQIEHTACCIVGGGPAGAMLALLLARQGIPVVLLEAHRDFERAFRGDTLHPSVMQILDEIGLAERLLQLRHTKVSTFGLPTPSGLLTVDLGPGFARFGTKFPYITVMAQARFLEFITAEAQRYPTFRLLMGAHVESLVEAEGVVQGVRYRHADGKGELRAALVVAADGRFSRVRKLAGLEPVRTAPPIDILWFRLSRREGDALEGLNARVAGGLFLILIDRFDYWQVGSIIAKGSYLQVRAAGLDQLRRSVAQAAPEVADRVDELQDWQQIAVLAVEASRLKRWYKPGLLFIGDAAHVMSPAGGVGINYAIADAVVVSNLLGPKLKAGTPLQERDLAAVQRQREWPTRLIQILQRFMQRAVRLGLARAERGVGVEPPRLLRRLLRSPRFLMLPAGVVGFGLWPPHVLTDAQEPEVVGNCV